jgi:hypothetical protein
VRDEHYSPFQGSDPPWREAVTVFVMARFRVDQTDSMRGSLRAGPHGWDAVYMLNGELYRSQWFAAEALARADLATHQDTRQAADGETNREFQFNGQDGVRRSSFRTRAVPNATILTGLKAPLTKGTSCSRDSSRWSPVPEIGSLAAFPYQAPGLKM